MKDLGISTFNRFNHGSNYNPHGQYDYIFPKKLTIGADVPLEAPNLWIKLWDFNISSAEGIKRALRTFHLQFDIMNLLSSDNLTSMHFEVSLSTMYGKLGYAVSKRYNAIDTNATSSLDEIKLHLFYRKEENYYHVKIYLRGMGGQLPVIYNARFWNMLGYDKVDPQFFPSNTLTNGAYLQQTKWFIENTDCSRIDTEQLLSETEGYEHLVSQLADYKVGRNLLKGTLDFNKDFWQIPSDSTTQIIDGYTYFNFSKANRAPLSLNQTVKLADNHRYTISFDAKSAKRSEISFELYGVGDGTEDLSIQPITFMLDEKIRRYSVDFHVSAKVLNLLTFKPILSSDQSIDAIGGGVTIGRYTLNDVAYDSAWRPYGD